MNFTRVIIAKIPSIVGEWPQPDLSFSKTSKCLSGRAIYTFIISPPMLISLTTLLATLRSIFRSRAALELKNLALRHQIGVLQRSSARKRPILTTGDRLLWVCLSRLWRDWRSAAGHRQARDGRGLAPQELSFVLDLEDPAGPAGKTDGSP